MDLWEGVEGSTKLQEIPGLEGYSVDHVELQAMIAEGEYVGITEVKHVARSVQWLRWPLLDICRIRTPAKNRRHQL